MTRSEFLTSASASVLFPESFKFVPATAPTVAPDSMPESFVPLPDSKESRSESPTLPLSNAWVSMTVDPFFIRKVVLPVKSIARSSFLKSTSSRTVLPESLRLTPALAPTVALSSMFVSFVF